MYKDLTKYLEYSGDGSSSGGRDVKNSLKNTEKKLPEINDSQVGKKLVDHASDYGLPKSREGANAYKSITQDVILNATDIRTGNWKTLGNCDFYIRGNDVAIVSNNQWVSTFPMTQSGTFNYIMSLPIK